MSLLVDNRRTMLRKAMREPAEIAFYNNGGLYYGSMTDLSGAGACFNIQLKSSENDSALVKGRRIDCCITTINGTSKCKGEIRWIKHHHNLTRCGIAFTELSSDEDDPLHATLRRYFTPANHHHRRHRVLCHHAGY